MSDVIKVKTVYQETVHISRSELEAGRKILHLYTPTGDRLTCEDVEVTAIHVGNLVLNAPFSSERYVKYVSSYGGDIPDADSIAMAASQYNDESSYSELAYQEAKRQGQSPRLEMSK